MFHLQSFDRPKTATSHDMSALEAANEAVNNFIRFVRDAHVGNDLVDEIELPVAKPVLVEAFKRVIVAEERTEMRALLLKAGLTLAQYHVGLGERIRVKPITIDRRKYPTDPKLARKFNRALLFTAAERTRLTQVYQEALKRGVH